MGAIEDIHGQLETRNQRVKMAAIGFALALVPEHVFDPLSAAEQQRLLTWLEPINRHPLAPNR